MSDEDLREFTIKMSVALKVPLEFLSMSFTLAGLEDDQYIFDFAAKKERNRHGPLFEHIP